MNYFTDYIHNAALSLLFTVLTCDDVENKCATVKAAEPDFSTIFAH